MRDREVLEARVSTEPCEKTHQLALVDELVGVYDYTPWQALRQVISIKQAALCTAEWAEAADLVAVPSKWHVEIREEVRKRLKLMMNQYFTMSCGPHKQRIKVVPYTLTGSTTTYGVHVELKPRFVIDLHRQMLLAREQAKQNYEAVKHLLGRGAYLPAYLLGQ